MRHVSCARMLFGVALVAVAVSALFAQTAASGLAKELAVTWDRAVTDILDVAEAMPEEKYDFKPVPEVATFREQLVHLAGIVQRFIDTAKGTKTEPAHKTMTKAEAIAHLKQTFDTGKEMFASLTDAQMLEHVKFSFGDRMVTRYGFWMGPLYQVRNHHGQYGGLSPPERHRPSDYRAAARVSRGRIFAAQAVVQASSSNTKSP